METQAEEPSSRSKRVQDRSTYGNCEKYPAAKNRKLSYKVCLHCNKELNIKIYKEHKRLYYDASKGVWSQESLLLDSDKEECSSEFSSIDEMNYNTDGMNSGNELIEEQYHSESDFSDLDTVPASLVVDSTVDQGQQENPCEDNDVEYWIESDTEINEDVEINVIPPQDLPLQKETTESVSSSNTSKWIITLLTIFQTRFFLTNRAIEWLLNFIVILLQYLSKYSTHLSELAARFPRSMHQYNNSLEKIVPINKFMKQAVCVKCETLYSFEDCYKKTRFNTTVKCCAYKPFQKSCNHPLMKEIVSSSGNRKMYPHKIYCFVSLISSLQNLLLRTGFIEQCESTRNMFSESGLSDVYDGTIWKDFMTIDDVPFLLQSNCYGLLLNIDWLQPYKHTQHSVGVIYIVILNLPRVVHFKRENVILFGVIPGPNEPSHTINSYLSPLVADLKQLWKGIKFKLPGGSDTAVFRCALLGVACDLPAGRKTCGFLSYSANLGCSRCFQHFSRGFGKRNYYADFDREKWEMRTNERHRSDVEEVMKAKTISQRNKKESELGCRYSTLLELPYFRPIEMLLIDTMHNLYLGTSKHFARDIWIAGNILSSNDLVKVEEKLRNTVAPVGLGRLPLSINIGHFLTADQWKNWTLYFSILCLGDTMSKPHLECWRKFVLACRRLCKHSITDDDIKVADKLLLRFCSQAVELYGEDVITPNMHMHCHLASCIREFGPSHSFWLFPFERYNGVLEEQPTNNRSIELQLMRRFQKDSAILHLHEEVKQWSDAEYFLDALPELNVDSSLSMNFDDSIKTGPKSTLGSFNEDLISIMRKLYSKLFPEFSSQILNGEVYISYTFRKYSTIQWHGKTLSSNMNKNAKNCFVMATPHFDFTSSSDTGFGRQERLAEIDYFLTHSVILPNISQPIANLLACAKWPLVHPQHEKYGNPARIWYRSLYEPCQINKYFLVSNVASQIVFNIESIHGEAICISVPVINN